MTFTTNDFNGNVLQLMRGRYGERVSICSEDLSVPTQPNEFRFVRHTLMTNDGIEHVKITYFIPF